MPRSWLASPWLLLLILGVLVMVALPVALYLWLNSEVSDISNSPASVTASRSAPVASVAGGRAVNLPAAAVPVSEKMGSEAGAAAEMPAAPAIPAATALAAPGSVVQLKFGEESWVEIKDAAGHVLHRQLNRAGSNVEVRGQPPFSVLIGNASKARLTYNGRPIDLNPFIEVTVARFTLEE